MTLSRPPAPSVSLRSPAPSRREPFRIRFARRSAVPIYKSILEEKPPSGREVDCRRQDGRSHRAQTLLRANATFLHTLRPAHTKNGRSQIAPTFMRFCRGELCSPACRPSRLLIKLISAALAGDRDIAHAARHAQALLALGAGEVAILLAVLHPVGPLGHGFGDLVGPL